MAKDQDGRVISFNKVREAKIEEKRRKYERVLFKNILGVYCVAEGQGLKAVELVNVSQEGLSFQLPHQSKNLENLKVGAELTFRFYFSQETYIPVHVKIQHEKDCLENGNKYFRFGCAVDQSSKSYEAYKLFVMFLSKYAETANQDKGDLKFFFF